MKEKTRFAPSPTGYLHVGGVRTALFDYLAAKSTGGEFVLRIEDTDRERFVEGAVDYIHEGLKWLGLKTDGEVVYQSDRLPIYQKYADELVTKGLAYKCFCTKERLAELKELQEKAGKPPVYDRECCKLSETEVAEKEKTLPFVIRFKIPDSSPVSSLVANPGISNEPSEGDPRVRKDDNTKSTNNGDADITWLDKIKDKISIPINTLEDFVIIKSDKWPTYNFANVIDDHEMKITLVIRGDEFVSSTPKHILLYQALGGWHPPEFAHAPVIVGADMKKLSKRNGDTALLDYREKGYLPEALINFLALLGWNPGTTEEIFTLDELSKVFSIDRVGKSPAVFDIDRLNWINGTWIRKLSIDELRTRLIAFDSKLAQIDNALLERIITVEQSRLKTLAEFAEITDFYHVVPKYTPTMLVFKKSSPQATKTGLEAVLEAISSINEENWVKVSVEDWNSLLSEIVAKNNLQNADVFWPIRAALSGLEKSPSPAELLWVLGRDDSLKRLQTASTLK